MCGVNMKKGKKLKLLTMGILVDKTNKEEMIKYIEEFKSVCDLTIEYDYKEHIITLKNENKEAIIYTKSDENAINFLEGIRIGLLDFNDVVVNLKGVNNDKTKNR